MICRRCKQEGPPGAKFCPFCGVLLGEGRDTTRRPKTRGNGTGSVWRLPNGHWIATVTLGYSVDEDGKRHRATRSRVFAKKVDAINAIPQLKREAPRIAITLGELLDRWLPTHEAGKSTLDGYKAAVKHFEALRWVKLDALTIDDLQDCIDECGHGRRTKENMRTALGLAYKDGIPRHLVPGDLNLAQFLRVDGEAAAHRDSFTDVQIERIRKAGTPETDVVLAMIYLGFRPSEFLSLTADDYDPAQRCFVGGAKTEAGKGRTVTVSPKILAIVQRLVAEGGYLVHRPDGRPWPLKLFTEKVFYPALEAAGIQNPIVEVAGGVERHKFTPHSCRHTFATLMKRVGGSDKDKQGLIGHASAEQLRDYQDVHFDDLRRITDAI